MIAGKNARADFPEERLPPAARREMEKRFRSRFSKKDPQTDGQNFHQQGVNTILILVCCMLEELLLPVYCLKGSQD
ncbi:hypothetical protein EON65_58650 [archaeon]|nr:MAG: hypothetical protein EON65_58650 [archaeon]